MPTRSFKTPESSTIEVVMYNSESQEMQIKFKSSSAIYIYKSVPATIVAELFVSDSVGRTFDQLIKKGGYSFTKASEVI